MKAPYIPMYFLLPLLGPLVAGVERAEALGRGYRANATVAEDSVGFAV
jgi:hypothetical protein